MGTMTKEQLIKFIEDSNVEYFEMDVTLTEPAQSWRLPDVRTGAIYPPTPMRIMEHTQPAKYEIRIRT